MIEIAKELLMSIGTVLIGITLNTLALFGISQVSYEQDGNFAQAPDKQTKEDITDKIIQTNEDGDRPQPEKSTENKNEATIKEEIIPPKKVVVVEETPIIIIQPEINIEPVMNSDELNTLARSALVNILCSTSVSGPFNPSSGSGIIIDPRGIVLTNAHIAQYFLLEDYGVKNYMNCVLRTGAPAYPTYDAEILYISPTWIKENKGNIIEENPIGTGENDFALLRINKHVRDDINLPDQFPFIELGTDENNITEGTPVLIAGYPAGFLGGIAIQKELWPITTFSYITKVFTFVSGTIDLISLNGNIAAQKGSSGGGVINANNGKLVGIIVTSTEAEQTKDRILNAITLPHINRSIFAEISTNLQSYLDGDLQARADNFNETISPSLTELLEDVLRK